MFGNLRVSLWAASLIVLSLSILIAGCDRQSKTGGGQSEPVALTAETLPPLKGEEQAVITTAPEVPPPIDRDYATKVILKLETKEVVGRLADGVEYTFWTFGGDVPGNFIRVREGDLVELHMSNHPDSKMPHNIDLHAVNGPGGGAESTFTAPGHTSVFSFRALNPGLYVYHCAVAPVGMHIANGMYGLILVEPQEGLPKVDREYYVMQSEFYTAGKWGDPGLQPFDMEKALEEDADYVVFNGEVGSLVGDRALSAQVGETVRLFVGNGGPNLISSFHVIGEIFDRVYPEGGANVQTNVQTTLVPAGGSAITEFEVNTTGTYILVDHAIFRAFNKGALGMLKVGGEENTEIYSGKLLDKVYMAEGGVSQSVKDEAPKGPKKERTYEEKMQAGQRVYEQVCMACHQAEGVGLGAVFPPLAKSDYLMKDEARAIRAVAKGLSGAITVNGKNYNGVMPALQLSENEIAAALTYVRNSFGNEGDETTLKEVREALAE